MLRLITLILPTIFPSWRFFKEIEPSPRLDYQVIDQGPPNLWHPAHQPIARLHPAQALRRLFWNRDWNEYLFLVSCSERMLIEPAQHLIDDIVARLCRRHGCAATHLVFRISLVDRAPAQPGHITSTPVYISTYPHAFRPDPAFD